MSLDSKHPDFMKFSTMFQDYWKLFKKFYSPAVGTPAEEDQWWDTFIAEDGEFAEKYDNIPFARALAVALTEEMERKYKENKR